MFLLANPHPQQIRNTMLGQSALAFSYPFVGATRDSTRPPGYTIDLNQIDLGAGEAVFERAVAAMRRWEMFGFDWMQLCWPDAPIREGTTVAVIASLPGIWSLNVCRIVYTIDENDERGRRFGFAYGTLPDHIERGEERFLLEWSRADDRVTYSILALSRPKSPLAWAGYPFARLMQRRFASASKAAMRQAVADR